MSNGFGKRDVEKLVNDLEKQVSKKLPKTVSIDRDQTDLQQIADLKNQFRKAGTKINTSEARRLAREIRKSQ